MDAAHLEYLTDQQCSRQWKGFLRAFAEEFATQLQEDDLRALMRRLGSRFAASMPVGAARSVDELQMAMGRAWIGLDWGWTALTEQDASLEIVHHCAPLQAAFGAAAVRWSPAFLEGAYQEWFAQADAGGLQVRQVGGPDANGSFTFRLGRHNA